MLKSWWTAAGAAAVVAGVLLAVAPSPPATQDEDEAMVLVGGRGGDHHGAPMYFVLEGKPVRGLYPGAVRQMKITVFNPLGAKLRVQQVSGKVTSSSRRGCPASTASLVVRPFTGVLPVVVPARGRTTLTGALPIAMPGGASEKCAGVRFTISVSATGYRVDR
jgi:hypothetical protein